MIALTAALMLALITRRSYENKAEFVRRWGFYTWWIAAVEVLWFTALEAYALVETAAKRDYTSLIATAAGLISEVLIVRGAWADFAVGALLVFISLLVEELEGAHLRIPRPRLMRGRARERRRAKPCFVEWHDGD